MERSYGLGRLVLYTAGTDHSRVELPGLEPRRRARSPQPPSAPGQRRCRLNAGCIRCRSSSISSDRFGSSSCRVWSCSSARDRRARLAGMADAARDSLCDRRDRPLDDVPLPIRSRRARDDERAHLPERTARAVRPDSEHRRRPERPASAAAGRRGPGRDGRRRRAGSAHARASLAGARGDARARAGRADRPCRPRRPLGRRLRSSSRGRSGARCLALGLRELLLAGFIDSKGLIIVCAAFGLLWEVGLFDPTIDFVFGENATGRGVIAPGWPRAARRGDAVHGPDRDPGARRSPRSCS